MFKTYLKETLIYVIDHFAVESKRHFNWAVCASLCLPIKLYPEQEEPDEKDNDAELAL